MLKTRMMDISGLMMLMLWISAMKINAEQTNTVTLPKDLYDILLQSFRQDNSDSDIHDLTQRLAATETKIGINSDDRIQLFNNCKVTTEVLERLTEVEKENAILKSSMTETTNRMQDMSNTIQELRDNMQETQNHIDVHIQEFTNASKQTTVDQENLTADITKLNKQIIRHDLEYNNLNEMVGKINFDLQNTSGNILKCDKFIENLTTTVDSSRHKIDVLQALYNVVNQTIERINETCSTGNVELNVDSDKIKQKIAALASEMAQSLNVTNERINNMHPSQEQTTPSHTNVSVTKPTTTEPDNSDRDCLDIYQRNNRHVSNGIYRITPKSGVSFDVYCDMTNGGWTVIQRRINRSVNFTRGWDNYVSGFGELVNNFWLGLDYIHALTNPAVDVFFDVIIKNTGERATSMYSNFTVDGLSNNFTMRVNQTGTYNKFALKYKFFKENGFGYHDYCQFRTFDHNSDNCVINWGNGGWWYRRCWRVLLNNPFYEMSMTGAARPGVIKSEIKIRRSID